MATSDEEIFKGGMAAWQAGKLDDAERSFTDILRRQPQQFATLNLLAIVLMQRGRFADAEPYLKTALKVDARSDAMFNNYGLVLKALGRFDEAAERFSRAVAINSANVLAWNNRGTVFSELKRFDEAIADFDRAVSLEAKFAEALCNKGNALGQLGRFEPAMLAYDKALAINPNSIDAWLGHGNVLRALQRHDDALAAYDKALALKSDLAAAYAGRGNVLHDLKRLDEAAGAYDKALAADAVSADAWLGRGNIACDLRCYDDAIAAYDKALAHKPGFAEAWGGRGNVFYSLRRYDEALSAYDKAISLKPNFAEAWYNRGNTFSKLHRYAEAAQSFERLIEIAPGYKFAKGHLLHMKMQCCDWRDFAALTQSIEADVGAGKPSAEPFGYQAVATSARNFQRCAEIYAADKYPKSPNPLWRGERYDNPKIRVGYLSGEFRSHITSMLMARVFELHDKNRFEIVAFDNGWDDGSDIRGRINKAFDTIVDIRGMDDLKAAAAIRERQIDILVNLNGYFGEERTGVFAHRPAPVAVNYLGFSATMGVDFIDYIVADRCIIPPEQIPFYTEKAVYLPDTFQANDDKRPLAGLAPARAAAGLPPTGFVFSCFSNNFKITPEIFDVWMRLLNQVDGSVLWLLESNPAVAVNLREEAKRRNVAPDRLVFAPRTKEYSDYLARFKAADLFLDTFPFNAGGTGSDALWAGLPLLTYSSEPYAARMAASIVAAAGLPELVARSLGDYEAMALKIARDPALLAAMKAKLDGNRNTCPLFDSARFTRHIEGAYTVMRDRAQRGEPPASFTVERVEQ